MAGAGSGGLGVAERSVAFLIGFPRSGTTLLEQVLASHPQIHAVGERPLLAEAEAAFMRGAGGFERLAAVVDDLLEPLREAFWRAAASFGAGSPGKMLVDKHPLHTLRLPLIARMFPRAKILFAIRDPRDVVLGGFRRAFNMNPSTWALTDLESAARYYDAVMTAGEIYRAALPLDVLEVRHEDLVAGFADVTGKLCDFLEVERRDLGDFAAGAAARAIATPSSAQIGRGLSDAGVAHWRRYAFALEPVLPILRPWVERFGYDAT